MATDLPIQSFNGGVLSPHLDGRSDLEKYYSGCRIFDNMISLPFGDAERRPGTYFVAETKDSTKKARLIPFQYSTVQAYQIEFGDQYCRFYKDRGQIQGGAGTEDISDLDNITAHWLLNETVGNAVVDDGATHDGTLADSVDASTVSTTGKVGTGCFDLDGQYCVEVADADTLSFTDNSNDKAFSIACWGFVTQQGNIQVLVSKWRDSGTTREWRFSLSKDRELQLHLADTSVDLSANTVAHWKLNEDAATKTVLDDTANNHDGATQVDNTADLTATGKISKCLNFGGTDAVVLDADSADHSFGNGTDDSAFSISAWVYVTTTGTQRHILAKWDETTAREWQFGINPSEKIQMTFADQSTGVPAYAISDDVLSTGWHFLVMTYDGTGGTTAANGILLYVDGYVVASTATNHASYTAMENTATKVAIGGRFTGGTIGEEYPDKIDNVALFDKVLTSDEILNLWNSGDGTENLTGVVISSVADTPLTLGWHFLVVTYSAPATQAAAADGIIFYVDSVAVDSTAVNSATYTAMQNGAEELRIGSQRNSGDTDNENYWGDKIDEVSIFSDVLTPTEVASLYSDTPYEIPSDYLEADLPGLQGVQSADVLYNQHSSYPPSKLLRYAHSYWELENIVFDWPPFLSENVTDTTITPSATVGTIELAATTPIFTSSHVGSYWQIKHNRSDNKIEKDITSDYSAYAVTGVSDILVDVQGVWRFRTTKASWDATLVVERSYDGTLILVLDSAPAGGAWSKGDIITGATSGDTCVIVSATDTTHYTIKQLSGSFTDGEVLSNQSGNSRDTAATYPRYEGWHTLDTFRSTADQNFDIAGDEEVGNAYLRVRCTTYVAQVDMILTCERYYHYGIVQITGFTSSKNVSATVIRTLGSTDATPLWSEAAWSDEKGYPVSSDFFEGRQYYAGSTGRPLDILGSRVNDYENMKIGPLDDDAVKFTVDSGMQNQIRWLVGEDVLLIGTDGAEWKLGSPDPADAITPTNPIRPKKQTTYGSKAIQALLLANVVLFVDSKGRRVRGAQYIFEKGEAGGYDAPDYSMYAEHITESGIVSMAYQQNPYPILWCVRTDGTLVGMVFEPGQKVWGWFNCVIDGLVESVSVNYGVTEDEVWIIVNRTINGAVKRYIEYFKPRDWGSDQADCFFVDSGLTFDGGDAVDITDITKASPAVVTVDEWPTDGDGNNIADGDQIKMATVVGMTEVNNKVFTVSSANVSAKTFELRDKLDTVGFSTLGADFTTYVSGGTVQKVDNIFAGLDHLEGKTVSVLGDGSVHADVTVSSGIVTLTDYYNKAHIGLGYDSKLQPMKLSIPGTGIRGKKKRISSIIFSFYKTLGAKYGTTVGAETIPFRKTSDPLGSPPPLFTGEKQQSFPGGYELNGDIYVEQTQPLPMTIRSITPKLGVYE